MTYSHYQMLNETTVVTIEGAGGEFFMAEATAAFKHLTKTSCQTSIGGVFRGIFTDKGDRSRFRAFEKAVEEARG